MLLTNWLRSIASGIRSSNPQRTRTQKNRRSRYFKRYHSAEQHRLNAGETLEDRTMLTSVFSVADIIVDEGDSGTTSAVFTVTRTGTNAGDLNEDVSIDYVTMDGTATRADGEYLLATGALTFSADPTALSQTETFTVQIIGDTLLEQDETFQVLIANNTGNTTIADSTATATINNDDFVYVSIEDITVNESDGTKTTKLVLSQTIDATFQVRVITSSGSATLGEDVSITQQTIYFYPNQEYRVAQFQIIDDTEVELNEHFFLDIVSVESNEYEIVVADSQAIVTIVDNDEPPLYIYNSEIQAVGTKHDSDFFGYSFSVDGDILIAGAPNWYQAQQNQGAAFIYVRNEQGTPDYTGDDTWEYQDTLLAADGAINDQFGKSVAISGNIAVVGSPYRNASDGTSDTGAIYIYKQFGSIWIHLQTISVPDLTANDNFGLNLAIDGDTLVVGAQSVGTGGTVFIYNSSNGLWTETARLTPETPLENEQFGASVAINNSTIAVGAKSNDETETNSGAVYTFSLREGIWTQTQKLKSSSPSPSAEFGKSISLKGDQLLIGAPHDQNNNEVTGAAYLFTFSNDAWSESQIFYPEEGITQSYFGNIVDFQEDHILVGTSSTQAPAAYLFRKIGQNWLLQTKVDPPDNEENSRFGTSIALVNDQFLIGDFADNNGKGNIHALSLSAVSELVVENARLFLERDGSRLLTFDVIRSGLKAGHLEYVQSIDFTTFNLDGAGAGGDYEALTGSVNFQADPAALTQTETVSLRIDGETPLLLDETFAIQLFNSHGSALIAEPVISVPVEIAPYRISAEDVTVAEGSGTATIIVTLDYPLDTDVSIEYATVDQSAHQSEDYTTTSGTLTFAAGEQSKTISIPIQDSDVMEFTETFLVNLSHIQTSSEDVTFRKNLAEVTIIDDDPLEIRVNDISTPEYGTFTFEVTLNHAAAYDITFLANTIEGTTSKSDYTFLSDMPFSIRAGELSTSITLHVVDDDEQEDNETFSLILSDAVVGGVAFADSLIFADNIGVATIQDDESFRGSYFTIEAIGNREFDFHFNFVEFEIRRYGGAPGDLNFDSYVDFSTIGGTATAGVDYEEETDTVLFPADPTDMVQTTRLRVRFFGDELRENTETIIGRLNNPTGGSRFRDDVESIEATAVIVNDDSEYQIEEILTANPTHANYSNSHFGEAVAIYDDVMVVGLPGNSSLEGSAGAVYIYSRDDKGTSYETDDTWDFETILYSEAPQENGYFGSSVAIYDDTIVVGAVGEDEDVRTDRGVVYVFTRTGSDWKTETPLEETVSYAGVSDDAQFGSSVGIYQGTIVVGAPTDYYSRGSVTIFEKRGVDWQTPYRHYLKPDNLGFHANFGNAVAIYQDTLIVGAPGDDAGGTNDTGSAYVYSKNGSNWTTNAPIQTKLSASDGVEDDQFGYSVATNGTDVVIGTYEANAAYLYDRNGSDWHTYVPYEIKYTANADESNFGRSVAISNYSVVIGAYQDNLSDTDGSAVAHVYSRRYSSWDPQSFYVYETILPARELRANMDHAVVAISGDTIVVGDPVYNSEANSDHSGFESGSISVYAQYSYYYHDWSKTVDLGPDQTEGTHNGNDGYGTDFDIDGDYMVVSAPANDSASAENGLVYIYRRDQSGTPGDDSDDTWIQNATIKAPDTVAIEEFGTHVAIDGDTILISALLEDGTYEIYLYEKNGGNWSSNPPLMIPFSQYYSFDITRRKRDEISDLEIEGDTILIGSSGYGNSGTPGNPGAVFVYTKNGPSWRTATPTESILFAYDAKHQDRFGSSIDIDGDKIIVGAPYEELRGAAYLFTKGATGWNDATQRKLIGFDSLPSTQSGNEDAFGSEVIVDGDTVIVSSPYHEGSNGKPLGAVYIFDGTTGWDNPVVTKLTSEADYSVNFGESIDYQNNLLVVGTGKSGYVYVYEKNDSWDNLHETKIITPYWHTPYFTGLKNNVMINGNNLVVASPDQVGKVYSLNRHPIPSIAIENTSVIEGNDGSQSVELTVTLSGIKPELYSEPITVDFTTIDSTATTADNDYQALSGTLSFDVNSGISTYTKVISIQMNGDNKVELDQAFLVAISNPSIIANVTQEIGVVTIENDDIATLSVQDVTAYRDLGPVEITVTLDHPVESAVSVSYSTADQTASSPDDYQPVSGVLTFEAGEQSKTITIPIVDNGVLNEPITFLLNLTDLNTEAGLDVILSDSQVVVSITERPIDSVFSIRATNTVEGDDGTVSMFFDINRTGSYAGDLNFTTTVDFSTIDGTATAGEDYDAESKTITFYASGSAITQSSRVYVQVKGDQVKELTESIIGRLHTPTAGSVLSNGEATLDATGFIANDDSDYIFQQSFSADPSNANYTEEYFGRSIAIDGDIMVVGVPDLLEYGGKFYPYIGEGAVYVYARNHQGTLTDQTDDTWDFQTSLLANPLLKNHYSFGSEVAVYGDTIVVGASEESSGKVYVFTSTGNDWTTLTPVVESLPTPSPRNFLNFGNDIAIFENTIVVGVRIDSSRVSNGGAAYIFEKQGGDWSTSLITQLLPTDLQAGDAFGNAVSIYEDIIVVGVENADPNGSGSGAAYVFTKNGANWSTTPPTSAKITPSHGSANDNFGHSVATNGVEVAIGAVSSDGIGSNIGSVFVYHRNGPNWYSLPPSEVEFLGENSYDYFGSSLAFTEDRLIVGARGSSKTYIYDKSGSDWNSSIIPQTVSSGTTSEINFGQTLAFSGSTLMIGAPLNDAMGTESGSIFVFDVNDTDQWTHTVELTPDETLMAHNGGDLFGNTIAIDGNYMVVGASGTDSSLAPKGTVYIYARNSQGTPNDDSDDTWVYQASLFPPDPDEVSIFGTEVAIDGGTILVEGTNTFGRTEVFIYERNGGDWFSNPPTVTPLLAEVSTTGNTYYTYSTMAIDGDTIVVGQKFGTGNTSNSGAVYVFTRQNEFWFVESPLTIVLYAADGEYDDRFGQSIDIEGDQIIVGAPEAGETGAAFLFEKGTSGWNTATQRKLNIDYPGTYSNLGTSVTIEGNLIAVAGQSDIETSGIVFLLDGSAGWDSPVVTSFIPTDRISRHYGGRIDLSGGTLVVSDGSLPGASARAVYIYDGTSGWDNLNETKLFFESDSELNPSFFGSEFVLNGTNLVVYASSGEPSAIGEVYSFNRKPLPEFSIDDASIVEGDSGTKSLELTVTLTGIDPDLMSGVVSIDYTTLDGTATSAGNDYQPKTGTLSFDTDSGTSTLTKTISINVVGDTLSELDEYFFVTLANSSSLSPILVKKGKVTIVNDDQSTVSIDDLVIASDQQTASVIVSLNRVHDKPVGVDFVTVDQTAVSPDDFLAASGTLTFNPGEQSKVIDITIFNSELIEADKTFLVNLLNLQVEGADYILADSQGEVTIVDSDQSSISINDLSVDEDAGTATLTVSLTHPINSQVTLDFSTAENSALNSSDYQAKSGTLTFAPNEISKTITIDIIDSDSVELDETFFVKLTNLQSDVYNLIFADDEAVVTIVDNDETSVSIDDVSVDENAGTATITVSLDHPVETTINVDFATQDNTAKNATDYLTTSGTLTFNPGETSQTFTVSLVDSNLVELDESFLINLTNLQANGADVILADNQAEVTIIDDDQAAISIDDVTVNEDDGTAILTVSLDQRVDTIVSVVFSTTAGSAESATDFLAQSGTLLFAPEELTQTITISLVDSDIVELDETFLVNLLNLQANGRNVTIADNEAEVTIVDNPVLVSINNVSVNENEGTATLTVTLDHQVDTTVTVDFATNDSSANSSTDYQASNGTLTFNSGDLTQTITVSLIDSDLVELDETFLVNLSNIQANGHNVAFADQQAVVTIVDDDQAEVSIDDVIVNENAGVAELTVSLSQAVDSTVTVDFSTSNQNARSGLDYESKTGTLTFNPEVLTQKITVNLIDTDLVEIDETFRVFLNNFQSNNTDVIFVDVVGQVTIVDDDQATISIDDVTVDEDAGTAILTVSLPQFVTTPVSIDYSTVNDSAISGSDYFNATGTLTFNINEHSKTITVNLINLDRVEADEIFWVNLTNIQSSSADVIFTDNQGEVTIVDDDQATISINDIVVNEDSGMATLTISLDTIVLTDLFVNYSMSDQSASNIQDYVNSSGILAIAAGQQTQIVKIPIIDSDLVEYDETFLVNLSELQADGYDVIFADDQAEVTIIDDDQAAISIDDVTVNEDDGTATLTVTLDQPVDTTISVDYQTTDNTATNTTDYLNHSGTLNFDAGEQTQTITVSIVDSDELEHDETFLVNLNNIQSNGHDVIFADNQGEVAILDEDIATAEVDLRVVDSPTHTQPDGTTDTLPDTQRWITEWATYWVELWVNVNTLSNQGIFSTELDLNYKTEYTSATEIEFGASFTQNQAGVINDAAGTIEGLAAETNASDLGINNYLLFARVKFEPLAEDQVELDVEGQNIGPYDLGFQISTPKVSLVGDVPVSTNLAAFAGTNIWANPYDLNDDDIINFRDLTMFASAFGSVPSESNLEYAWFSDFNQSDRIDFRDLILFATNYGKHKLGRTTFNYGLNFPDAWNQPILVDTQFKPQTEAKSISQPSAETVLKSVVDQVSPGLDVSETNKLDNLDIQVVDLADDMLGRAVPGTIYIDNNAAGHGWFVDVTPNDHNEFSYSSELTLLALPESEAANQIDLWSVIMHEIGHILGREHEAEGMMQERLAPGVRKLPAWERDSEWDHQAGATDSFFSSMQDEKDLMPF